MTQAAESRRALVAGIGCYVIWGFIPLAFQQMSAHGADPWEIMAHRTVWAVPFALAVVLLSRQWGGFVAALKDRRAMAWLACSTVLIAINWTVYVGAVTSGRALDASLGYYLNPLLNMAAGAWLFRERIDRFGAAAIVMAGIGVALQALALGHPPWISLIVAFTFCAYGVIRKRISVEAQPGLLLECALLSVLGLAWVIWLESHGQGHFTTSPASAFWLIFSGAVTVVPMGMFAWAARRLPLSTMGFIQFIAPTMVFIIGVMQGEAFGWLRAVSFAFIWAGVAAYAVGAVVRTRRIRAAEILPE